VDLGFGELAVDVTDKDLQNGSVVGGKVGILRINASLESIL
tara:strand:- start:3344 stop:3466 length:123 start_codon:yes stop_codon:yes gene_type:complete